MLTETEWEQLQQRMTIAWHRGDFHTAFTELERALAEGTSEIKNQALIYRGMIHESRGDLIAAKRDVADAVSRSDAGSYARYVAERTLGEVHSRLGAQEEALEWYRAALTTCAQGGDFSGGLALAAFLELHGPQLSSVDERLVASVTKKSWAVMELPGEPDLNDLAASARTLAKKAQRP